jgi:hypothetical protein
MRRQLERWLAETRAEHDEGCSWIWDPRATGASTTGTVPLKPILGLPEGSTSPSYSTGTTTASQPLLP